MVTVRYALRRDELWAWYWSVWKRTLWFYHVASIAMVVLTFMALDIGGSLASAGLTGAIFGVFLVGAMILYPQLRYRSEERTLTFDGSGLSYQRGKQSGRMPWRKIRSVTSHGDTIVVTGRSHSAFTIPARAFPDAEHRRAALAEIVALHQAA
jgi:hypothetical protein